MRFKNTFSFLNYRDSLVPAYSSTGLKIKFRADRVFYKLIFGEYGAGLCHIYLIKADVQNGTGKVSHFVATALKTLLNGQLQIESSV